MSAPDESGGAPRPRGPQDCTVTLVLPCLNEELAIGACVSDALATFAAAGIDGTVLVVDNGSVDDSIKAAKDAGAEVVFQPEQGYGAALRTGIEQATSTYVVMADADGTYELGAMPRLLEPLIADEADLVLGSRLDHATKESMPWLHRYVGTPMITFLIKRATGGRLQIKDSQSGFRAFRRDQMLSLHLASTGMEFASEMLMRSAWARFRVAEVPTVYRPRVGDSKLNTFSDGLRHLRQILLLSPEIFAIEPGMVMTVASLVLWALASTSTHGLGRAGSLSWLAIEVAGILSVIGPVTYCTGLGLKYRAESLGFRHKSPRYKLTTLIWRFFFVGVALLGVTVVINVVLVANFRSTSHFLDEPVAVVMGSAARTAAIIGLFLASAPILTPFLTHSPRPLLPPADGE